MLLNSLPNSEVNWRNQPVGYDMLLWNSRREPAHA